MNCKCPSCGFEFESEDYEDDFYEEKEPEQPEGLPGWAFARQLFFLEPIYGEWLQFPTTDEKSGLPMLSSMREVFTKAGISDGFEFRLGAPPSFGYELPKDLFEEN